MNKLIIPETEKKISQIIYGTGSIHRIFSIKQRIKILKLALELGISHFDTSPYYGYGVAEKTLGELRKSNKNFTISTKIGLYPSIFNGQGTILEMLSRKFIGRIYPEFTLPYINWNIKKAKISLDNSLRNLNSEQIDILLFHEPELGLIKFDEFKYWLQKEKNNGKILAYGLAGSSNKLKNIIKFHPNDFNILQANEVIKTKKNYLNIIYNIFKNNIEKSKEQKINILRKYIQNHPNLGLLISSNKEKHLLEISKLW